jgi:hypothetical protein
LDLGIETETITRMVFFPRVNKASIQTSSDPFDTWGLKFNIPIEPISEDFFVGYLTNGNRTIKVLQTNLDYLLADFVPVYVNEGLDFMSL